MITRTSQTVVTQIPAPLSALNLYVSNSVLDAWVVSGIEYLDNLNAGPDLRSFNLSCADLYKYLQIQHLFCKTNNVSYSIHSSVVSFLVVSVLPLEVSKA